MLGNNKKTSIPKKENRCLFVVFSKKDDIIETIKKLNGDVNMPNCDFCINCRKNTEYTFQKKDITKAINGKEHTFTITVAICSECGEEMSIPRLIDKNIEEVEQQYKNYQSSTI